MAESKIYSVILAAARTVENLIENAGKRHEMRESGDFPQWLDEHLDSIAFSGQVTEQVLRLKLLDLLERMGLTSFQPALDAISASLGMTGSLHSVALAAEPDSGILDSRLANASSRARLEDETLLKKVAQTVEIAPEQIVNLLSQASFILKQSKAEMFQKDPETILELVRLLTLLRGKGLEARFLTIMAKREDYLSAVEKTLSSRNRLSVSERQKIPAMIELLRNNVRFINPDNAALNEYTASELKAGRGIAVLGDDASSLENALNFRLDESIVPKRSLSLLMPVIILGGTLAASQTRGKASFAEQQVLLPELLGKIFEGARINYRNRLWNFENVEGMLRWMLEVQAAAIIDQSA
jgi:hypothetical protein